MHRHRFEVEYARLYEEIGLGTTIWSPLGSGLLTGKYNDGIPKNSRLNLPNYEWLQEFIMTEGADVRVNKMPRLVEVAKDLGISMAGLALAWCLKNTNVSTAITGASSVSQIEDNMKANMQHAHAACTWYSACTCVVSAWPRTASTMAGLSLSFTVKMQQEAGPGVLKV